MAALTPGTCAARDAARRFQEDVSASIRRVPVRYREPLASAANDLAARLAPCTEPPPPEEGKPPKHREHGHGKHKGNGEGND